MARAMSGGRAGLGPQVGGLRLRVDLDRVEVEGDGSQLRGAVAPEPGVDEVVAVAVGPVSSQLDDVVVRVDVSGPRTVERTASPTINLILLRQPELEVREGSDALRSSV